MSAWSESEKPRTENTVAAPEPPRKLERQLRIGAEQAGQTAVDLLAERTGLSKSALKDAMNKGAVWLNPTRGNRRRLRRAQTKLQTGDLLKIFYDIDLLKMDVPQPRLLADERGYSLWYKPAGLLSQGTDFGDHASLLRLAELWLREARKDANATTWLVHRLDREARGLMLVAHDRKTAGALSRLFQEGGIDKIYWAEVRGETPEKGIIDEPLDDKTAHTEYQRLSVDGARNLSRLELLIDSGRQHQIRRHLEFIGHPVMGDPRYGQDNKNKSGLKLVAWRLAFQCPLSRKAKQYDLAQLAPDLFNPVGTPSGTPDSGSAAAPIVD